MENKRFLSVMEETAHMDIPVSMAFKAIRQRSGELCGKEFLAIVGKASRTSLKEKICNGVVA